MTTDRLDEIASRLASVPSGTYSWRGNTDSPDGIHLAAPSYTDAEGTRHFSRSVISLLRHEITADEARRRGVGDPDFYAAKPFYEHPLTAWQKADVDCGDAVAFRDIGEDESEADYGKALDAAHDAHMEAARAKHIREYLADRYGEPRTEYRLALTDENGFLVEADTLAIYEVAPEATDPNDPKLYRRDITGLRHPVAEFLAHAADDMAHLLAEVQRLQAFERDALASGSGASHA